MTAARFQSGLGARGRALWKSVDGPYVLDPAEKLLLLELARNADELDRLTKAMAGAPPTVPGSKGQPVAHPLLAELRAHREVARTLAKALGLPAIDGAAGRSARRPAIVKATNRRA